MSFKKRLEDKIRRKEEELQGLVSRAREGEAYLQALYETLKMIPRDENEDSRDKLRTGSIIYNAYMLLKKKGKPLHITEIIGGLGEKNTKSKRVSLSGSLGWYVRKNSIFNRPSPNTFGLIDSEPESPEVDERPSDISFKKSPP